MKKIILTTVVALFCFSASAQYTVMSNINEPSNGESWGVDNFTNNIGIGYQVNNDIMVGVQKNEDDYGIIGRYSIDDMFYLSATIADTDSLENITFGIGTSIKIWDKLYVEPQYTIKNNDGSLNLGLSYKL
jgi:hypothetical protein